MGDQQEIKYFDNFSKFVKFSKKCRNKPENACRTEIHRVGEFQIL